MNFRTPFSTLFLISFAAALLPAHLPAATVTGRIVDDATKQPVSARIYVRHENARWFFPTSSVPEGSAIRYQKQNWINTNAVEQHTTLSAHPFQIQLEPGRYTFEVERGKEYQTFSTQIQIGEEPMNLTLPISRWVNMARRGWYSGDTHVHRDPAELPNVMLAEDVNVVLPMVYWTTTDRIPPSRSDKNVKGDHGAKLVTVDPTHVYYPRNTEYEIFNAGGRSHTLGALLVLNHQSVLDLPALPVRKVAEKARAEGAWLDLEKHNWPWSMALVPLVQPDFFELANNHHWRTDFSITNWAVPGADWMQIGNGLDTELHWTLYGFQNYYALLDCGYRLRPGAGTANGVHPVPLGFGRVYVHLDGAFSYEAWMKAWHAGRSFVTTGPMLLAKIDGEFPGHQFTDKTEGLRRAKISGSVLSQAPVSHVEVIVNGTLTERLPVRGTKNRDGAWEAEFETKAELDGSGWVAVRCWEERGGGRIRFAHTGPTYFERPGSPLRPRREEVEFLVQRVRSEIERSKPVLSPEGLAEYQEALAAYESLARTAR